MRVTCGGSALAVLPGLGLCPGLVRAGALSLRQDSIAKTAANASIAIDDKLGRTAPSACDGAGDCTTCCCGGRGEGGGGACRLCGVALLVALLVRSMVLLGLGAPSLRRGVALPGLSRPLGRALASSTALECSHEERCSWKKSSSLTGSGGAGGGLGCGGGGGASGGIGGLDGRTSGTYDGALERGGDACCTSSTNDSLNHSPACGAPVQVPPFAHSGSNRGAVDCETPSDSPGGLIQKKASA